MRLFPVFKARKASIFHVALISRTYFIAFRIQVCVKLGEKGVFLNCPRSISEVTFDHMCELSETT